MKIYLSSYLNNNLGDDLMIQMVCDRYPSHDFYISNTNNLKQIACKCPNLHVIESITPLDHQLIKRAINKVISYIGIPKIQIIQKFVGEEYDLNLELGGSIFMQITRKSWKNKVRDAKFITSHCKFNLIIGSNFGPYFSKDFQIQHALLFKKYDMVTFRDHYSYNLFSDLPNVRCYSDIVFNMPLTSRKEDKPVVGISVISSTNRGIINFQEKYIKGIVSMINELRNECSIALMSFCENEGDLDMCKSILEYGGFSKDCIRVFNHTNVKETMNFVSSLSGMICTRFHANVIALSLEIPFVPIIYSDKISAMLDDLEYSGYRWNIEKGDDLDLRNAVFQLSIIPDINLKIKKNAEGHLSILDSVLN